MSFGSSSNTTGSNLASPTNPGSEWRVSRARMSNRLLAFSPHEQLKMIMIMMMNAGITWADKRCKMWRYRICFSSKWTPSAALTALNGWSSMQTPQPFAIFKWQHFKSPQYGNLWQGPWWTEICAKSSFLIRKQMWMASLRTADVKIRKFVHRYTLIVWWLCSCLFAFSILKNTD